MLVLPGGSGGAPPSNVLVLRWHIKDMLEGEVEQHLPQHHGWQISKLGPGYILATFKLGSSSSLQQLLRV